MVEVTEELLNVYDPAGHVIGVQPRRLAKASGCAVGAINLLVANPRGEVLLQRRPIDKENGGSWDKSVGGHVSAGETFDQAAVREAGEELFDDPAAPQVRLAGPNQDYAQIRAELDPTRHVVLRQRSLQLNLRDVRQAPGNAGIRNVLYHVAVYTGHTDIPTAAFRRQAVEVDELRYFGPAAIDRMLLRGELAPNMAFLWLTHAHELLQP